MLIPPIYFQPCFQLQRLNARLNDCHESKNYCFDAKCSKNCKELSNCKRINEFRRNVKLLEKSQTAFAALSSHHLLRVNRFRTECIIQQVVQVQRMPP